MNRTKLQDEEVSRLGSNSTKEMETSDFSISFGAVGG